MSGPHSGVVWETFCCLLRARSMVSRHDSINLSWAFKADITYRAFIFYLPNRQDKEVLTWFTSILFFIISFNMLCRINIHILRRAESALHLNLLSVNGGYLGVRNLERSSTRLQWKVYEMNTDSSAETCCSWSELDLKRMLWSWRLS